ncbi:hypothetical protein, partial [Pantoea agglomerans]|uniref:hypothetical protein n=1 Tax=Enterobacter agglomerans TaxID=549 RepID=UPI003208E4A1
MSRFYPPLHRSSVSQSRRLLKPPAEQAIRDSYVTRNVVMLSLKVFSLFFVAVLLLSLGAS